VINYILDNKMNNILIFKTLLKSQNMKYSPGDLFVGIIFAGLILYGCLIQNISQFYPTNNGIISEGYYLTVCFFGGGIVGIVLVYLIGCDYYNTKKEDPKKEREPLLKDKKKQDATRCSKSPRHILRMIFATTWFLNLYVAWGYDSSITPVPNDTIILANRILSYVFTFGGGAYVWTNDVSLDAKLFIGLVVLVFSYYFASTLTTVAGFLTCYQKLAFSGVAVYFGFILQSEPVLSKNVNKMTLKQEVKIAIHLASVYLFHTYAYNPFFTLPGSTMYPITTFQLMSIGLFVGVLFHWILNYYKAINSIVAFMIIISFGTIFIFYGLDIGSTSDEFYSIAFFYGLSFGYIDSVLLKWTYALKIHNLWYLIAACSGCATMIAFPVGHDLIIPILGTSTGFCGLQIVNLVYPYVYKYFYPL
jgi:hypothetical protein